MNQLAIPPLRTLLFSFHEMLFQSPAEPERISPGAHHTLLACTGGSGAVQIGETSLALAKGTCFLLPPDTSCLVAPAAEESVSYFRLDFFVYQMEDQSSHPYRGKLFAGADDFVVHPFSPVLQKLQTLYSTRHPDNDPGGMRERILFHELLELIFAAKRNADKHLSPELAVEQTRAFLHTHFQEPITVEQLASLAHLPRWQYSHLFKSLTGQKPLDYLTDLRIRRAKELLLYSDDRLYEIADQVGFKDQYYFNRRFRQATGVTPRQFIRMQQERLSYRDATGRKIALHPAPERIVMIGDAPGELLALGVSPVGINKANSSGILYQEQLFGVADIGHPVDWEKIAELQPDLILLGFCEDEELIRKLSRIAPIVTYNKYAPLYQRFRTIATIVGRQQLAEEWIATHEQKLNALKRHLPLPNREETASSFICQDGKLFVMAGKGLLSTLYGSGMVNAQANIRKLIAQHVAFAEVTPEQLPLFCGDRVYLIQSANDSQTRQQLERTAQWSNLPAVQNGQAYLIDDKWNYDDPITKQYLLDELPVLLGQTS